MPDQALAGVTVIDLSQDISGPYCTRLLADCGASVIKVEPPIAGDPSRRSGPFPGDEADPEKSGLFLLLNAGKKGITLDLQSQAGRRIFKQLADKADVLVENFPPGVLAKLGIDFESLSTMNPALIMASISYFGQWGPYRDWDATDIVAQATGGLMWLTGDPDREPLRLPLPQADYIAGLHAAVAVMCALYHRDATGEGQHIDISVQEAVASILEGALTAYDYSGYVMKRAGSRHQQKCPSKVMQAKDRHVHIQSGANWDHFATLVEEPKLMQPRLASILRYRYADEVEGLIQPWVAGHIAREIFEKAQEWRIPAATVLRPDELPDDPQYKSRDYFQAIDHPAAGRLTYPGPAFRMSRTPPEMRRAPLLGEHNGEVYGVMLGLSRDDVVALKEQGVI